MIKAIIADRDPKTIVTLRKMLHKNYADLTVDGFANNLAQTKDLVLNIQPDLLFLEADLAVQGVQGAIQSVKENELPTVFMTGSTQYALKQLSPGISESISKPICLNSLKLTMNSIMHKMMTAEIQTKFSVLLENVDILSNQSKKIIIKDKETIHIVRISEILFCEADGGYTLFHLQNGQKIIASKGLKTYSQQLENHGFYRIHHSFLVNQSHISKYNRVDSVLVLENGVTIPVSVRKKENLEALLTNRFFL